MLFWGVWTRLSSGQEVSSSSHLDEKPSLDLAAAVCRCNPHFILSQASFGAPSNVGNECGNYLKVNTFLIFF